MKEIQTIIAIVKNQIDQIKHNKSIQQPVHQTNKAKVAPPHNVSHQTMEALPIPPNPNHADTQNNSANPAIPNQDNEPIPKDK